MGKKKENGNKDGNGNGNEWKRKEMGHMVVRALLARQCNVLSVSPPST
jgi:hypothetical protein